MSERDEFEAFWRREMNTEVMDLCRTEYPMTAPKDQQYKCHETNLAWITWQAARATLPTLDGWSIEQDQEGDWLIHSPSGDGVCVQSSHQSPLAEVVRQLCQSLGTLPATDSKEHAS